MKKKKNYLQMRVTNAEGERVTLKLPEKYRVYFDKALMDNNNLEYDNSLDAMVRFFEEYFTLDDADRELFQDIIFCRLVNPLSIVDITILTQSLDEYAILKGVSTPAEIAEFYSYLAKRFEPDSLTANMTEDMYDKIGKEVVEKEKGQFYKGNYYFRTQNKLRIK